MKNNLRLYENSNISEHLQTIFCAIGFAKKAGCLKVGFDACTLEAAKGNVRLAFITEDISENTQKKFIKVLEQYNINYIVLPCSSQLLAKKCGNLNPAATAAIIGKGGFENIIFRKIQSS